MNKLLLVLFLRLARAACYLQFAVSFFWVFCWEIVYWHKPLDVALNVSTWNTLTLVLGLVFAVALGVLEDLYGLNHAATPSGLTLEKKKEEPKGKVLYCVKCKRQVTREDLNETANGNVVHKHHKLIWKTVEANNKPAETTKPEKTSRETSTATQKIPLY